MTRNGTKKSLDRAQEIYLAAAQIIFSKGYNATSLNEIADALDITKAGLYYYVESKQDLLYQIVKLGLDDVQREVLNPARKIADAEKRLRFIITNHSRLSAGGNHAVIIISHEVDALNFDQRQTVQNDRLARALVSGDGQIVGRKGLRRCLSNGSARFAARADSFAESAKRLSHFKRSVSEANLTFRFFSESLRGLKRRRRISLFLEKKTARFL